MKATELVLGIDPGLANTGWGIIAHQTRNSDARALAYGVITTRAEDSLSTRLVSIEDEVADVIRTYHPSVCAREGVFFGASAKSSLSLGQARACAILAAARAGLTLAEYPPATIKKVITGEGRAEKEQVAYMVRQLLALDHEPHPDHCSDALAVALTHAAMSGRTATIE